MQLTVQELGRASLQLQTLHIQAVESGMHGYDKIELPSSAFVPELNAPVPREPPTLNEYTAQFLNRRKAFSGENSTYYLYERYLTRDILPIFGKMHLQELTENQLQSYVNQSVRKGWSTAYIRAHITLLKSILKSAEHDNLLQFPKMRILYPRQPKTEIDVLTESETELLNTFLTKDMRTISTAILIALHTGIRIGEMCGLHWSDVDFKRHRIHIQRTVKSYCTTSGKYFSTIGTTKTPRSNQIIYLTDDFANLLKERQGMGYIYTGTEKFIDTCSARQALDRRLEKLKINHIRFHALRHGFATRAIKKGVDPKTVSAILGHEHCDMTLNIYTACTPQMQVEAMRKVF